MTVKSPGLRRRVLTATVALGTFSLCGGTVFATSILYFADSSRGGGSGGGGGAGGGTGASGGGVGFPGSAGSGGARDATAATPVTLETSAATETSVASLSYGDVGTPSGAATDSPASASSSSLPSAVSIDPLADFFEDVAVKLDAVDIVERPQQSAPLTYAFDASEIISIAEGASPIQNVADGPLDFGIPATGVTLTIDNFPPDSEPSSFVGIENPEPASLLLVGTGMLLIARRRHLTKWMRRTERQLQK